MIAGFIDLCKAANTSAADRVYDTLLPRGYHLPAVAIHRYGGAQEYQFDGPAGVREDQLQVDVYGSTAAEARAVSTVLRERLARYVGTLSDGTVVLACFLEKDMDMPFLANADQKGIASRALLGFRVISNNPAAE